MKNNHWELEIYKKKNQLNKFPFLGIVSFFKNKRFKKKSKIKVLEIGCGAGNNLLFLAKEGFNVSGTDVSPSAINFAKKAFVKNKLKCCFKVSDSKNLNWPNDYFDFVIDRACLTHNTNQHISTILNQAHRVLKKNGKILCYDFFGKKSSDINYGKKLISNTYYKFKRGRFKNLGLVSFFDYKILKDLFYKFKIVNIENLIMRNKQKNIVFESFNLIAKK